MALPNLPVQGQNPWFEDRNSWDSAVEELLDGLPAIYRNKSSEAINALDYGSVKNKATLIAAMNAAEARGVGYVVLIPEGVWELGTGISMSGYTCQLQGVGGSAGNTANPRGTVLKASTQTGPVIDWTGWIPPEGFQGRVRHGNFHVVGSGVADATKNNSGMRFSSMSSSVFYDIAIRETGGPGLEGVETPGNGVYLNVFERVTVSTPVNCKANDVPYMIFNEANGNAFIGCGIRSRQYDSDCGVSGAVVLKSNASFPVNRTLFDGFWVEFIHVPTDGTIFAVQGNTMFFRNTLFFDIHKEVGATGTSAYRFTAPATDYGGNIVDGEIPGRQPTVLDYGVDMRQNGNYVTGIKGYNGYNVLLASGVSGTTVFLSGTISNSTNPAWEDNSGNRSNTLIDNHLGTRQYGYRIASGLPIVQVAGQHIFNRIGNNGTNVTTNFTLAYGAATHHTATLGASVAITSVSGAVNGAELTLILTQDATGGRNITAWPSNFRFTNSTPTLASAPGARSVFTFFFDGTNWVEISRLL
jgi:hypothetical protein